MINLSLEITPPEDLSEVIHILGKGNKRLRLGHSQVNVEPNQKLGDPDAGTSPEARSAEK